MQNENIIMHSADSHALQFATNIFKYPTKLYSLLLVTLYDSVRNAYFIHDGLSW